MKRALKIPGTFQGTFTLDIAVGSNDNASVFIEKVKPKVNG